MRVMECFQLAIVIVIAAKMASSASSYLQDIRIYRDGAQLHYSVIPTQPVISLTEKQYKAMVKGSFRLGHVAYDYLLKIGQHREPADIPVKYLTMCSSQGLSSCGEERSGFLLGHTRDIVRDDETGRYMRLDLDKYRIVEYQHKSGPVFKSVEIKIIPGETLFPPVLHIYYSSRSIYTKCMHSASISKSFQSSSVRTFFKIVNEDDQQLNIPVAHVTCDRLLPRYHTNVPVYDYTSFMDNTEDISSVDNTNDDNSLMDNSDYASFVDITNDTSSMNNINDMSSIDNTDDTSFIDNTDDASFVDSTDYASFVDNTDNTSFVSNENAVHPNELKATECMKKKVVASLHITRNNECFQGNHAVNSFNTINDDEVFTRSDQSPVHKATNDDDEQIETSNDGQDEQNSEPDRMTLDITSTYIDRGFHGIPESIRTFAHLDVTCETSNMTHHSLSSPRHETGCSSNSLIDNICSHTANPKDSITMHGIRLYPDSNAVYHISTRKFKTSLVYMAYLRAYANESTPLKISAFPFVEIHFFPDTCRVQSGLMTLYHKTDFICTRNMSTSEHVYKCRVHHLPHACIVVMATYRSGSANYYYTVNIPYGGKRQLRLYHRLPMKNVRTIQSSHHNPHVMFNVSTNTVLYQLTLDYQHWYNWDAYITSEDVE